MNHKEAYNLCVLSLKNKEFDIRLLEYCKGRWCTDCIFNVGVGECHLDETEFMEWRTQLNSIDNRLKELGRKVTL